MKIGGGCPGGGAPADMDVGVIYRVMFVALYSITDWDAKPSLEAETICSPRSSGPLNVICPMRLV